ncbi:MAG TPA: hypothetical protein VGL72_17960 [Bryobacteraceae bacterium]|jgi:hypothetical protein
MASDPEVERRTLARALAPGKDCPPIEKLEVCIESDTAPADLAHHLESCAYCRTELELMRSFYAPPRDEAEAEIVRAIAERLHSPRQPAREERQAWWKTVFHARWWSLNGLSPALMGAACILIAVAAGLQWRNSNRQHLFHVTNPPDQEILRSGAINILSPSGDVKAIPDRIQWEAAPGAAQYRVSILEVDHNPLWSASTPLNQLELPASVKAQIVPAKTILVQVVAFDSSNQKLAESDFVRFRLLQTIHNR